MTEKLYHTISEVAEMFHVNASLIRFWEKEFPFLKAHKNNKGNRIYTKKDIENIRLIYNLVKEKGYTIQGARDYLSSNKNEAEKNMEVIRSLKQIREFLLEIDKELA